MKKDLKMHEKNKQINIKINIDFVFFAKKRNKRKVKLFIGG